MSKSKLEKNFEDIFDLPEQEPLASEVVKKEVNELVGEYTFVDSSNNEVVWKKMKIGQGIRIK